MPWTLTQSIDLEIPTAITLCGIGKENHEYLSKTMKPSMLIDLFMLHCVGLGWPEFREHYIRNMWFHRCALWDHLVARYQRCGKKFIFQRCTFHHPNVYENLMFFSLQHKNHYQKNAGNYTPSSPTLSTRLCNSNGESPKHEEEDELCSEEVDSRRQDLQV